MKKILHTIVLLNLLLFLPFFINAQLPAFPGAEGFGSTTAGGRFGTVLKVTNLNADGPGSFKAALDTNITRIIVFETGGTIEINGKLEIHHPNLTIAGQTAPGDGISLKNGTLSVQTHDVIMRGLRFRVGDLPNGHTNGARDGLELTTAMAYNIIVDHCSFAWGVDENASATAGAHDYTFSWNMTAEALHCSIHPKGCHSKGLLFHKTSGINATGHHNIIMSNHERNPQVKAGANEIYNNFIYNYGFHGAKVWLNTDEYANFINNHYVPGPNTVGINQNNPRKGIKILEDDLPAHGGFGTVPNSIYVEGNIGPGREVINSNDPAEEWQIIDDSESTQNTQSLAPFPLSGTLTIDPTLSLETLLLAADGAGAIIPYRDSVDERILQTFYNDTGALVDCVTPDSLIYDGGFVQNSNDTSAWLDNNASDFDNKYITEQIEITGGTGAGQTRTVIDYFGATHQAVVDTPWDIVPDQTSTYHIKKECSRNAGGWKVMNPGTPPTDTDGDGMPDDWENNNGTNPLVADDALDPDMDGYTNIEDYINHFYTASTVLAVEFLDFSANPLENAILLKWSIANEINNAGLEIQRSSDGLHFSKLDWLDAKANDSNISNYEYRDLAVLSNNRYYYRLKQVDFNGKETYSGIISAILEDGIVDLTTFPQPVGNHLNIAFQSLETQTGHIFIKNVIGQAQFEQTVALGKGYNHFAINASNLQAGIYLVEVLVGEKKWLKKVLKH